MTGAAGDGAIHFDDGAAYESFMGRWSRAAGALFLDWLAPAAHVRWLEIGCGTGAFTRLVSERCRPMAIVAIDPAAPQVAYARRCLNADRVAFYVAAAEALPCPDASIDIIVSALAINFMADRMGAVREMRRVARVGGTIAGYVWDFAAQRTPNAPLLRALHRLGIGAPVAPGGNECDLEALHSLFASAGLFDIETTALDIEVRFPNFTTFWIAQTPNFSPVTRLISCLDEPQHARLTDTLRSELPIRSDGSIAYPARAHAVKARAP